jgi:hypothetical protein
VSKLGWETLNWIRAWNWIRSEKPIVNCHRTDKSALCNKMPVIPVNNRKRIIGKGGGGCEGGGEQLGIADTHPPPKNRVTRFDELFSPIG